MPGGVKIKNSEGGSILLLSLWVLVILAVFSASVGSIARQRLKYLQTMEIRSKLRQIADSGLKLAVNSVLYAKNYNADSIRYLQMAPDKFRNIPMGDGYFDIVFTDPVTGNRRYGIGDVNARVNINAVNNLRKLSNIIKYYGKISDEKASDLAASIGDWKDTDDVVNAGGAEARYYRAQSPQYNPRNGNLGSLEELLLIKGFSPEVYDRVSDAFSLYGTTGVNINTSSPELIEAMGVPASVAARIMGYLAGPDRVRGTADDRIFSSAETAADELDRIYRLSKDEKDAFNNALSTKGLRVNTSIFEATVEAHLRNRAEMLTFSCVFDVNGTVKECREAYSRQLTEREKAEGPES